MDVYRIVSKKWSSPGLICNGGGAAKDGGRWNPFGVPCNYCGQIQNVSLAEMGFHKGIQPLMDFRDNDNLLIYLQNYHGAEYHLCLLKIDVNTDDLIDLSTPEKLKAAAEIFGVDLSFEEALESRYLLSPGTRLLARKIIDSGAPGLITQSARDIGRCVVIYPENLPDKSCRKMYQKSIKLYYSTENKSIWDGRNPTEIFQEGMLAEEFHSRKRPMKFINVRLGGIP